MRLLKILLTLLAVSVASSAGAAFTALDSTRAVGNQGYTGNLGMDFNVLSPIYVTHLGAFDSNQDGINGQGISVGIFDRTTASLVTGISLITSANPLTGNSRFEDISDVLLGIGEYSIVAVGYGSAEPNGNAGSGGTPPTINTGGGLISFAGTARYTSSTSLTFPTTIDGGPANRYDAGTFMFTAAESVPAPGIIALLVAGIAGIRIVRRSTS